MNLLQKLLDIGFKKIGHWEKINQGNNEIDYKIYCDSSFDKSILYAFVLKSEVKYIGKTIGMLKKRMDGYKNPAQTQSTNIKNKKYILDTLEQKKSVDIYVFSDIKLLKYGDFQISLVAGLEDSLIK